MNKDPQLKRVCTISLALLLNFSVTVSQENTTEEWRKQAHEMVEQQITRRGIYTPKILRVMEETPRHRFIPPTLRKYAYSDFALPIGSGQTISQPYIVALMTDLLDLEPDHTVLEIGTGSGYQAAILAPLVKQVYTIEIIQSLAEEADRLLKEMGYENITVIWGDGYEGWEAAAPFDRIIVTAAPASIPEKLVAQLKVGGKMVLPVGEDWQELVVVNKLSSGEIEQQSVSPVRFVPMIHPDQPFE
jgi:protein-L-isoaspartate(D-aspartate) O-methyltransferase